MKIIDPGHVYEVQNLGEESTQTITFIKKEPVAEGSTELKTVVDGTTNEEILAVLIDRLNILNAKFASEETVQAIASIQEALDLLNKRTEDRKARGVEGQAVA